MNNLYTCQMHAAIRCLDKYMSFMTGTLMHGRESGRVALGYQLSFLFFKFLLGVLLTSRLVLLCFMHVLILIFFLVKWPIWLICIYYLFYRQILCLFYSQIWNSSCACFIQQSCFLSLLFLCLFPPEIEVCTNYFTPGLIFVGASLTLVQVALFSIKFFPMSRTLFLIMCLF